MGEHAEGERTVETFSAEDVDPLYIGLLSGSDRAIRSIDAIAVPVAKFNNWLPRWRVSGSAGDTARLREHVYQITEGNEQSVQKVPRALLAIGSYIEYINQVLPVLSRILGAIERKSDMTGLVKLGEVRRKEIVAYFLTEYEECAAVIDGRSRMDDATALTITQIAALLEELFETLATGKVTTLADLQKAVTMPQADWNIWQVRDTLVKHRLAMRRRMTRLDELATSLSNVSDHIEKQVIPALNDADQAQAPRKPAAAPRGIDVSQASTRTKIPHGDFLIFIPGLQPLFDDVQKFTELIKLGGREIYLLRGLADRHEHMSKLCQPLLDHFDSLTKSWELARPALVRLLQLVNGFDELGMDSHAPAKPLPEHDVHLALSTFAERLTMQVLADDRSDPPFDLVYMAGTLGYDSASLRYIKNVGKLPDLVEESLCSAPDLVDLQHQISCCLSILDHCLGYLPNLVAMVTACKDTAELFREKMSNARGRFTST